MHRDDSARGRGLGPAIYFTVYEEKEQNPEHEIEAHEADNREPGVTR